MTGFLLDTNVVSLLSPTRAEPSRALLAWLDEADAASGLFLSAVTVHEIERGIVLLERKGASAKANSLRSWMTGLFAAYEDRILPVDIAASAVSGRLEAEAIGAGHDPGMADALIAGTAKAHDLTLVTQNLRHFEPFGIDLDGCTLLTRRRRNRYGCGRLAVARDALAAKQGDPGLAQIAASLRSAEAELASRARTRERAAEQDRGLGLDDDMASEEDREGVPRFIDIQDTRRAPSFAGPIERQTLGRLSAD